MKRTTNTLRLMKMAIIAGLCLSAALLSFGCVPGPAILSLEIASATETALVGDTLTYNILIFNGMPVYQRLTLTQTFSLPVEIGTVSIQNATQPDATCTTSDNQIICTDILAVPSASVPITVAVTIRAITAGTLISTASITHEGFEVFPGSPTGTVTTTVTEGHGAPDLSVIVTGSPDPVPVGNPLSYTITLTNNRQESVSDLTFVDNLPTSVTLISALGAGCSLQAGAITCSNIGIVGGASVTYQFDVIPTTIGTITNTLSIPGRPPITTETAVSPAEADLAVTMSDAPDPVLLGDNLTYLITVRNNGPSRATGVTLIDTLPSGVDFVSATSGQGSCTQSGNTVSCNLADDPADPVCPDCAIVTLTVRTTLVATISNTATATASEGDSNTANNSATAVTMVTSPDAHLVVTMTDNPDPVVVNGDVTYTINVANDGPANATNVIVVDTLPADSDVLSLTPSQGSCDLFGPIRACFLGSVVNGASATITLVVRPRFAGTVSNTIIALAENDPSFSRATESTTVNPPLVPDLSVIVSDSPDPVVVNQPLTYTITVSNNGLGEALGPIVTATLPATVLVNSGPDFNCSPSGGNIVCHTAALGRLASNGHFSLSLLVTPTTPGTISNTVNVSHSGTDSNPADDTVTETTTVDPLTKVADVSIVVSDSPDPVVIDQPLAYNVTVRNNGLATATGMMVTATLPADFNYTGLFLFLCPSVGGTRVCHIPVPDLANGSSFTLTLEGLPISAGTLTVTAGVSADEADPIPANNTATETTTVVESPPTVIDLQIVSVSDSPDPAIVNQQFAYTIVVRNNSLIPATGVRVDNTLSAGVVSDGGILCSGGSGPVIQCGTFNISGGGTLTVGFLARSSVAGTVTNTVSVTAQEPDTDSRNNTRTETTTIYPADSADLVMSIAAVPDHVALGGEVTFTLLVQNTGPQAATGVTLTGFSFASLEQLDVISSQGTCSFAPYPVQACNIGTLASGGSATVTIRASPFDLGILTQTVTATSSNDPNAANNTGTVNVTVNPP